MKPLAAGVAAACLAACTACGGGTTSGTTKQPGTAPSRSTADLIALGLQKSDLPADWTGQAPSAGNAADDSGDAELYSCLGVMDITKDNVAEELVTYSRDSALISSTVDTYKTGADVDVVAHMFSNAKLKDCITTGLAAQVGSGARLGAITLTSGTDGGPANEVGSLTVPVTETSGGSTATATIRIVFLTGPGVTGEVTFTDPGTAIDAALQASTVKAVGARIAKD